MMRFSMKYLFLLLLFGAALAAVADSLKVRDAALKCKDIKVYRKILPTLESIWKYLIQKYRCEKVTSIQENGPKCGIRGAVKSSISLKIAGGKTVVENSWPWQVSIITGKMEVFEDCDGTLIAEDWVLTSASCIKARYTNTSRTPFVRVGDHHIIRDDAHQQKIEISKIISHPRFKDNPFDNLNDIALLRLKRKVSLNDRVNAACLPGQRLNLAPGTKCTVLGWGMKVKGNEITDLNQVNLELQEVEMPLVSHLQCKSKLSFSDVKPSMHICAAGEKGKATRGGDIGVPLLCPKIDDGRKRWYLAGVFSFGIENSGTKYEVFTRVSAYSEWIKRMQRMYAN